MIIAGAVLLTLLLMKRTKRKTKQELSSSNDTPLGTDNDDGKYIPLPSAVQMHNRAIPKQKIQLKQQIASGRHDTVLQLLLFFGPD